MFRSFVVIAEIIVLTIVLRSSFVQYMFAGAQNTVSDWFVAIAEIPDQAELAKLNERVSPNFQAMRPYQKAYLDEVMQSRTGVNHFYEFYCVKGDKNPYISGASLHYFCTSIKQTQLLDVAMNRSG